MPKRLCPFEYDMIPQKKVHISDKEVCDEEYGKSVIGNTYIVGHLN
ncbi:hypothetical protein L798_04801 [Zootermopsis nevadensis]|uniref:Uncharacterized protein n=1 Tax=Zootermopsis nevadensis TaxID=136037 RepID=A0A067RJZ0_ZOONE|nr:hypothetical protein L798_04801 [Zootermopsis nevadensis]